MVGGHYGEIYKICKNFSEDEKRLAVMTMPTKLLEEELDRRSNHYATIFDELFEVLEHSEIDTLDNAEETLKTLKTVLKVK